MLVYFFDLKRLSKPLNEYSQLEEMLALRSLGWSYMALADKFNVPKTTIRYLCRRFGLANNVRVTVLRQDVSTTTSHHIETYTEEDRINPGKTYAEYLQEEKDRKWRKLLQSQQK